MAVLGMETSSGDFEVIDLCFAGLPDIYTPPAAPAANGKGKAKATGDSMEVDANGKRFWSSLMGLMLIYRRGVRQDLGRNGVWAIYGRARSSSGLEG
jgi:DNA polymerase delta subunit 2